MLEMYIDGWAKHWTFRNSAFFCANHNFLIMAEQINLLSLVPIHILHRSPYRALFTEGFSHVLD